MNLWCYFVFVGNNEHDPSLLVELTIRTSSALASGIVCVLIGWGARLVFRWGNSGLRDTSAPRRALLRWLVAWALTFLWIALLLAAVAAEGRCMPDHRRNVRLMHALWDPRGGTNDRTDMINGKIVAAVIVVWSLIWPHVKLLMLHVAYYAPLAWRRRERITYLLAFFGKWSFTDALTMIVVVGNSGVH